jgi:hypothetical protein
MMRKYPDRCRELFLARKSSNGKILKTGLTHYISNPWREFTIRLPDSSDNNYMTNFHDNSFEIDGSMQ